MRNLPRFLASALAAGAIVLVGASSAFAAATPSSASLDANWCFQSGTTQYCYDIDGTVHYLDTTVGSSVTIQKTTRATVYESGELVRESMGVNMFRGVFQADGTVITETVTNTRVSGDDPCSYRLVLRLVDYEAVVIETYTSCL